MTAADVVLDDSRPIRPQDEVLELCRDLIRIDTSNYGDDSGPGEREAAEYIVAQLAEVGFDAQMFESEPGRTTVALRIEGTDPTRDALVLHGHTDVVPAQADEWSVDPFAAEVRGGLVWGRGAVDMKNMDAMILAVVRSMGREGWRPPRDLIVVFFADEEAGGKLGSQWMVANHPEIFEGASEAISEVGGYSIDLAGQRAYLLQTAEKGLAWMKLIAEGRAGHGSQINHNNAVTAVAGAIERIGNYAWPVHKTKTVQALVDGVAELTGIDANMDDPDARAEFFKTIGPISKFVESTFSTTTNPSQLDAGYKVNVIPRVASAAVDMRPLPGQEDESLAKLKELAGPEVRVEEIHRDIGLEVPFSGDLVDCMSDAVTTEDPGSVVLPYMVSGGTDNKALARLSITGYGFAPLKLAPELDFAAMFHGVDERVNISALEFGARVMERMLRSC